MTFLTFYQLKIFLLSKVEIKNGKCIHAPNSLRSVRSKKREARFFLAQNVVWLYFLRRNVGFMNAKFLIVTNADGPISYYDGRKACSVPPECS